MYALCLVLGSTAVAQVNYLNKAMERFGNTETVPVYYVLFTLTTISGSNVLFRDFEHEDRCARHAFHAASRAVVGVRLPLGPRLTDSAASALSPAALVAHRRPPPAALTRRTRGADGQ